MTRLNYKHGLEELRSIIQSRDPQHLPDFFLLEHRLCECMEREQVYGPSSNNDVERNQVVHRLSQFTNEHFYPHFIDLCRSGDHFDLSFVDREGSESTKPSTAKYEKWEGGAEITVQGNRYCVRKPIMLAWTSDRSTLYQRAKAQQIGSNRLVWVKQVQVHRSTQASSLWKSALQKEARLLDMLEEEQRISFPRRLALESAAFILTLVHTATEGRSWDQAFHLSGNPLNNQLTHMLLRNAISLCEMLSVLHRKKLSHRELAPENILLLDGRRSVLQDTGLAARRYEPGEGLDLYRAPEQAISSRNLSAPDLYTDVYQLGVILYHLMTGRMPTSPWQLSPPSLWNKAISPDLDTVLLRAIAVNAKERWRTASEFSSEIRKALSS